MISQLLFEKVYDTEEMTYTARFLLISYIGLVWHSTAEATASWSTIEGTLGVPLRVLWEYAAATVTGVLHGVALRSVHTTPQLLCVVALHPPAQNLTCQCVAFQVKFICSTCMHIHLDSSLHLTQSQLPEYLWRYFAAMYALSLAPDCSRLGLSSPNIHVQFGKVTKATIFWLAWVLSIQKLLKPNLPLADVHHVTNNLKFKMVIFIFSLTLTKPCDYP